MAERKLLLKFFIIITEVLKSFLSENMLYHGKLSSI